MISFLRHFVCNKPPTRLEWAVVALIVVVLAALLYPSVQSWGSGQRTVPVLVHVFDAATGKPIIGARVTIIKTLCPAEDAEESEYRFPVEFHDSDDDVGLKHGTTDASGRARIEFTFNTDSFQRGLEKRVLWTFTCSARVYVTGEGYGGVVVPARHEPTRRVGAIKDLTIYVPVGLFPPTATPLKPDQVKQPSLNE